MKDRAAWTEWATKRKQAHAEAAFDCELAVLEAAQHAPKPAAPKVKPARLYQPQRQVVGKFYPLVQLCIAHGLPEPIPEYHFARERGRMYRADYCWPQPYMIIIEINGGAFINGRHTRGQGYLDDIERQNLAVKMGYKVLQYPPNKLSDAIEDLKEMLRG